MIQIYNTLSGKKEDLPKTRPLRLFVCGPTVYDFSHIGHARTYIAFDIIVRYLRHQGIKIFYLQNITDIDDKIINRAKRDNKKPKVIANFFEKAYYQDMKDLGVAGVNKYALASKFIKEIRKQISKLIKKGYAYQTDSGVWFEVKKFANYGRLSKQNLNALRPGYHIEPDLTKKDPLDFALWKNKKYPWEPSWPSPWGEGRPGWHIEDTAISEKFFGVQYDLHGGAVDLKFPHHESEIAQQEAASGEEPFVKIWMHSGFLLVNGEKMSKSIGNFITIREFLKTYPPETLRYLVLAHHYRSPIDYKEDLARQTRQSLSNIKSFFGRLSLLKNRGVANKKVAILLKKAGKEFESAMDDDFNTPDALAALFRLINHVEPGIWKLNRKEAKLIREFLIEKIKIFGLDSISRQDKVPSKIKQLAKKRELCRTNKQFINADLLRNKINTLGYKVEDTPKGPFIYAR